MKERLTELTSTIYSYDMYMYIFLKSKLKYSVILLMFVYFTIGVELLMNTVLDRSVSFDDSVLCSGGRVVDFTQNNLQKSKLFANSLGVLTKGFGVLTKGFKTNSI